MGLFTIFTQKINFTLYTKIKRIRGYFCLKVFVVWSLEYILKHFLYSRIEESFLLDRLLLNRLFLRLGAARCRQTSALLLQCWMRGASLEEEEEQLPVPVQF